LNRSPAHHPVRSLPRSQDCRARDPALAGDAQTRLSFPSDLAPRGRSSLSTTRAWP
jgi:hypothetical protein